MRYDSLGLYSRQLSADLGRYLLTHVGIIGAIGTCGGMDVAIGMNEEDKTTAVMLPYKRSELPSVQTRMEDTLHNLYRYDVQLIVLLIVFQKSSTSTILTLEYIAVRMSLH